jgi:Notch-like protein
MTGNGNTGYTCTCAEGYAGTNCEEDINECDPDPCQNGATCTETLDGTTPTVGVYHCECVAGYTGYACNIEIPCAATPCQNGATCSEIVSTDPTYTVIGQQNTCSSYDGYRGLTADECENVPNTVAMVLYGDGLGVHTYGACAYNGMGGTMLGVIDDSQPDLCFFSTCACIKPVVEYTCDCENGYNGTNCEEDINECDPDPCQNSAVCSESGTNISVALAVYHCECASGYSGTNCETIDDPCQLATCNSGECLTTIIMQPYNTFVEDIDQTIAL